MFLTFLCLNVELIALMEHFGKDLSNPQSVESFMRRFPFPILFCFTFVLQVQKKGANEHGMLPTSWQAAWVATAQSWIGLLVCQWKFLQFQVNEKMTPQ